MDILGALRKLIGIGQPQQNGFSTLIKGSVVPQYQRRMQRGDKVRMF